MHRLTPTLDAPALLAADLALLQVGKLPQVMHRVELANLHKPRAHAFHHLPARLEAAPPVSLPLEQISGVESVGSKLEYSSQVARRSRRPEGEFLHERRSFSVDERLKLGIKLGEFGVVLDGIEGCVVTFVSLVFPDMDYL